MTITDVERRILAELVLDPRKSDNAISRATGIPLKTVNRKRKDLELRGILNYLVHVDNSEMGTGLLLGSQLFIVKFRFGITRKIFFDSSEKLINSKEMKDKFRHMRRHMHQVSLCEHEGHLTMLFHLESRVDDDILEIFNSDVYPVLSDLFGRDCVESTQSMKLTHNLLFFNNYLPYSNMEYGKLKKGVNSSDIVID